ncbi:MAG: hypothetical protein CMJ75_16270 [Planctomycetaceae bacterium]|nr:hypothetical protein [Planctomycetaceae bacterium]
MITQRIGSHRLPASVAAYDTFLFVCRLNSALLHPSVSLCLLMTDPEPQDESSPENSIEELARSAFSQTDDPPDVSLHELSQAYSQLMGDADASSQEQSVETQVEQQRKAADEGDRTPVGVEDTVEQAGDVSPRSILEALLFVGHPENVPLTSQQTADLMRGVEAVEIAGLVEELNALYEDEGSPYSIVSVDSGYRLELRDEFSRLRDKFYGRVREARLSAAAMEVLAIVAYSQPQTRDAIDAARGRASSGLLRQLVRRRLLRMDRPPESPRTPHYCTTDRFLQVFGLADLDDLPQSEDLEGG